MSSDPIYWSGERGSSRLQSDTTLCLECGKLNFEKLLRPDGFVLHRSLAELRECVVHGVYLGMRCDLCFQIYSKLSDERGFSSQIEELGPTPWLAQDKDSSVFVSLSISERSHDPEWGERQRPKKDLIVAVYRHSGGSAGARNAPTLVRRVPEVASIYTVKHDPATVAGIPWIRPIGTNSSSSKSLQTARKWISDCVAGHCVATDRSQQLSNSLATVPEPERPSRVIEVDREGCSLRLVNGHQFTGPYAALSYVWGRQEAVWRTTKANVAQREAHFSTRELPKTLSNAVTVTYQLGIRLLWVDCLCIVQDDAEEWDVEAARMALVYNHAYVTLLAAASEDSTAGLFNNRSSLWLANVGHALISSTLTNGSQSVLCFDFAPPESLQQRRQDRLAQSTLATRAWCCQEKLLSTRCLLFGQNQMQFECVHGSNFEDNHDEDEDRVDNAVQQLRRALAPETAGNEDISGFSRWDKRSKGWLSLWYNKIVAAEYSRREVTYEKDKLNALAGLAAIFYDRRPMRYLAGLWEQNLVAGMCWYRITKAWETSRTASALAPSWSWASQKGEVRWRANFNLPEEVYASIISAHVDSNPLNPFGQTLGGYVRLRAPTIRTHLDLGDSPNKHRVSLSGNSVKRSWAWVYLDDFDGDRPPAQDLDVAICLMVTFKGASKFQIAVFLVLKSFQAGYKRIGLANAWSRGSGLSQRTTMTSADLLEICNAPLEDLTIV